MKAIVDIYVNKKHPYTIFMAVSQNECSFYLDNVYIAGLDITARKVYIKHPSGDYITIPTGDLDANEVAAYVYQFRKNRGWGPE